MSARQSFGRVLRTGLVGKAQVLLRGLGRKGDHPSRIDWAEVWIVIGLCALGAYIMDGHRFPDPLPIAIGAALFALSRIKDQMER